MSVSTSGSLRARQWHRAPLPEVVPRAGFLDCWPEPRHMAPPPWRPAPKADLLRLVLYLTFLGAPCCAPALPSCKEDEYPVGTECCPKCSPGYRVKQVCGELTGTVCEPCPPGTYIAHLNGLSKCLKCQMCDPEIGFPHDPRGGGHLEAGARLGGGRQGNQTQGHAFELERRAQPCRQRLCPVRASSQAQHSRCSPGQAGLRLRQGLGLQGGTSSWASCEQNSSWSALKAYAWDLGFTPQPACPVQCPPLL
ncbi:tumor necrosis factor receptor superfamily member 5-like isoform X3 [Sapajus apella]|uniref:Tumor necrosis factor receptor superfamily member 5-like isoform X3 n=1 Tax=Sapajus apella TaxID=9515 RepID=A0A6J3HI15_SAPAP|nr:tumor necrosis factor receptor superfamily member 5-like isoform X3 [Sapajus apella]